jgi:hypothetical protein
MERQRQWAAERARSRIVSPAAKARWNRAYKMKRKGLTPEQFQEMLEAQGYACAMCREPFGEDQQIFIDHDHACPAGHDPEMGCPECVRGLLCLTCNIALGYIETYFELAMTYLRQGTALRPAGWGLAGHSGLAD